MQKVINLRISHFLDKSSIQTLAIEKRLRKKMHFKQQGLLTVQERGLLSGLEDESGLEELVMAEVQEEVLEELVMAEVQEEVVEELVLVAEVEEEEVVEE